MLLRLNALMAAVLLFVGCDDPKKAAVATATPSAPASTVAPPPAPAPVAETPKKKEPIQCEAAPTTVTFHMPGLEAEVRKKLAKADGPLTPADLAKVKSVNLTSVPVDDLDPCVFPMLKGMKDLFLGRGELSDLSPLATLTQLASLRATENRVADGSPLAKMTKMDRLDLSKTAIKDIAFVSGMTELTELTIDDTAVEDLSPLAKATKLEKFSAKHTKVKDIHALAGLKKLRNVWLEGAPVDDTKALAPLVSNGLKVQF